MIDVCACGTRGAEVPAACVTVREEQEGKALLAEVSWKGLMGEEVDTVQVFTKGMWNIGQRMWEMGCCALEVVAGSWDVG